MNIYAESSAILSWLLGEPRGKDVVETLSQADAVVASDLTVIECERSLLRAVHRTLLTEGEAADRLSTFRAVLHGWNMLGIQGEIVQRARRTFPLEPVRSLDAIHLASALTARSSLPGLVMLTLDERIRNNAKALGLGLHPS